MKPSALFNHEDKTEELLCGQDTKQLRNNTWKRDKQKNTMQFKDNKRRKLRTCKSVKAKE